MPFISVVIPVYNVEKFVKRCVESLVNQHYKDCELILVDDGSTDSSGLICDKLAEKYNEVRALHKENGGLASARNYGLQYVNGEYVTFVDSDDFVSNNYFEFLDAHLILSRPDLLKFGFQRLRNGTPSPATVPYFKEGLYDRNAIETDILPGSVGPYRLFDYEKLAVLSACTCAYRTEFLKNNHIIFRSEREILSEDYLFNYTALLKAQQIEISHEYPYIYDYRDGSLSKCYKPDMLQRMLNLQNAYKNELQASGLYDKFRDRYYSVCVDGFYACITNECCDWNQSDFKSVAKNVRSILSLPRCRKAVKLCHHRGLSLKGSIIYSLMRFRCARLMCFLYKTVKKS